MGQKNMSHGQDWISPFFKLKCCMPSIFMVGFDPQYPFRAYVTAADVIVESMFNFVSTCLPANF